MRGGVRQWLQRQQVRLVAGLRAADASLRRLLVGAAHNAGAPLAGATSRGADRRDLSRPYKAISRTILTGRKALVKRLVAIGHSVRLGIRSRRSRAALLVLVGAVAAGIPGMLLAGSDVSQGAPGLPKAPVVRTVPI